MALPLRILLAGSTTGNRHLAASLEDLGHELHLVATGVAARDAAEATRFDLILMSLEMPEMDGIEATMLIREREQGTGRRVAIIAMTGHASRDEREQCLAIGIDECVTSQVQVAELMALIGRLGPCGASSRGNTASSEDAGIAGVLDEEALRTTVDGDEELMLELVALFLTDSRRMMGDIRTAVAAGDAVALQQAAHALKGSAATVAARSVAAGALALETLALHGELTGSKDALVLLETELHRLGDALQGLEARGWR